MFRLSTLDDGVSYRETLEGLLSRHLSPAKRSELEAELAAPPLPRALEHLWRAFHRLRRRKGGNGFGPLPLEWGDIEAFQRLSGMKFDPFEVEVIEDLDDLFLADHSREK